MENEIGGDVFLVLDSIVTKVEYKLLPPMWCSIRKGNADEIELFRQNEGFQSKFGGSNRIFGYIGQRYYCKHGGRKGTCRSMMLDIEKENCIELYHNNIPHCHTDLKFKLTPQEVLGTRVTELIDHAFAANVTTVGKMERYFERVGEDIKNIDNDAVQAYLNNLKKAYAPEAPPDNCYTMLDLATFAHKYSEIPNLSVDDNWDMAWVADHYPKLADGDEETKVISNEFSLAFTTPRLLSLHSYGGPIHADGSYGSNHFNFPYLLVGTSDANCHFHPTLFVICRGEKKEDYASER